MGGFLFALLILNLISAGAWHSYMENHGRLLRVLALVTVSNCLKNPKIRLIDVGNIWNFHPQALFDIWLCLNPEIKYMGNTYFSSSNALLMKRMVGPCEKWVDMVVKLLCFAAVIVQLGFNLKSFLHPKLPTTQVKDVRLKDLDSFPLIVKICSQPKHWTFEYLNI